MIKDYSKAVMSTKTSPEGVALYEKVKGLEGREYNRAMSGYFLDDMLDMLNDKQSFWTFCRICLLSCRLCNRGCLTPLRSILNLWNSPKTLKR